MKKENEGGGDAASESGPGSPLVSPAKAPEDTAAIPIATQAREHNDLDAMSAMAAANQDIAFFPDVLDMKAVKKGAQVRVGITNEAMQKLARSYTGVGPRYVGLFVMVNYEEFMMQHRELARVSDHKGATKERSPSEATGAKRTPDERGAGNPADAQKPNTDEVSKARRLAEEEYQPAWGPSPGGKAVDHNHSQRKGYAKAWERALPIMERLAYALKVARQNMTNTYHNKPRIGMEEGCILADEAMEEYNKIQQTLNDGNHHFRVLQQLHR